VTQSQDEQDRNDAALAKLAQRRPSALARLLASLVGTDRETLQERITRGQAWLARNERKDGEQ
jgi:hypothetical protein